MRIVRHGLEDPPETAIAVGSFDGVHRGHQAILQQVVEEAHARGVAAAVLTFEPLPREFFARDLPPVRLTSLAERVALLADCGVDITYVERFDARFAAISADDFAMRLRRCYGAHWVMVGHDFRFGARRGGDVDHLQAAGRRIGFEVEILPPVLGGASRISSTAIREALEMGDFQTATELLGRPYAICGRVLHGAKRGRLLGFPTANVRLARPRPALHGIFAVKCYGAATRGLEGVASLGTNPAIGAGGPATLEAFLFDFSGDIYGRRISIEFVKKLREEAHFASLDELSAQIRRDCDAARAFFAAMER
ncbi:MAG TPA: bifunctional riboflavin kinase/FAD synthetase [Usitatibacter sp.]|jgi:riboflavin kinase / FMN adenylyltransferase|nr:bifunctional riboflavin kinase/FAD synthetase [Usitatibacter sp.]